MVRCGSTLAVRPWLRFMKKGPRAAPPLSPKTSAPPFKTGVWCARPQRDARRIDAAAWHACRGPGAARGPSRVRRQGAHAARRRVAAPDAGRQVWRAGCAHGGGGGPHSLHSIGPASSNISRLHWTDSSRTGPSRGLSFQSHPPCYAKNGGWRSPCGPAGRRTAGMPQKNRCDARVAAAPNGGQRAEKVGRGAQEMRQPRARQEKVGPDEKGKCR